MPDAAGRRDEPQPSTGGELNDPDSCEPDLLPLDPLELDVPCRDASVVYQLALQRSFGDESQPGDAERIWADAVDASVAFFQDLATAPAAEQLWGGAAPFPAPGSTTCEMGCSPVHPAAPVTTSLDSLEEALRAVEVGQAPELPIPLTCAAHSMMDECERLTQSTAESCVGILMTDGRATGCDPDLTELAGRIASENTFRTQYWVIALPGADEVGVAQLTRAFGLDCEQNPDHWACPLASPETGVERALELLLDNLAFVVTTVGCVQTDRCRLEIPTVEELRTTTIPEHRIGVRRVAADGSPLELLGRTTSEGECGDEGGWYFDPPDDPTLVHLCPSTCDALDPATRERFVLEVPCPVLLD